MDFETDNKWKIARGKGISTDGLADISEWNLRRSSITMEDSGLVSTTAAESQTCYVSSR